MARRSNSTCYMCDAPATSREHAPALCFFPEQTDSIGGIDLRRNLITVPSCDPHNTAKATDDEYLWLVILATNSLNDCGEQMVRTKVTRSIDRSPALASTLLDDAIPAQVYNSIRGEWQQTVLAEFEKTRFYTRLEMVGRALWFHHFKRKWRASVTAFPNFVTFHPASVPSAASRAYRQVLSIADKGFLNAPRHGENPSAFFYQVHADHTQGLIRATFYGLAAVTLAFTPKPMGPTELFV